jgi:anti-sigma-K factor RskA
MSMTGESEWERGGDDMLAAEYVLGALPAAERRAVAARIEAEPEFARLVDQWEARFAPLAASYEEVPPPQAVKRALDHRLFSAAAPDRAARPRLWSSLAFWRALAAAAIITHVIQVAVPLISPPAETGERLVASLNPRDSDVRYVAVYDPDAEGVGLSHVSGPQPEGRDFELWIIEGDNPPRSLGVIPEGETIRIPLDPATRDSLGQGAVLAISVEPEGGSPSGAPTGPVVAAGDLKAL